MSTFVSPAQRFEADRNRFPAMPLREILIWKNWLAKNPVRFDRYEYNVRLGDGVDPGPSYDSASRRAWILNTQKRADVVAVKGSLVTIIEVEENPGLTAFGQLNGYAALWRARMRNGGPSAVNKFLGVEDLFPTDLPLDPDPSVLLVVARVGNDALSVAQASGVRIEQVDTDFSVLKASPAK